MTALHGLITTLIYCLLVVLLTAITTRLLACLLLYRRLSRDPPLDDVTQSRDHDVVPATVSVNAAQTGRSFTVMSELRFSETKV